MNNHNFKTVALLFGTMLALLGGICIGYELHKPPPKVKKGYNLIGPNLGINESGDSIFVESVTLRSLKTY